MVVTPLLESGYATDPSSITPACFAALSVFFFAAALLVVGAAAALVTAAGSTQGLYATNYSVINNSAKVVSSSTLAHEMLLAAHGR